MNLEEAKENIGKEVLLNNKDHNFKLLSESAIKEYGSSYKMIIKGCNHCHVEVNILGCDGDILESLFARPEAIKLKEQPMNYKIKVTPETSAEVQELFFELNYAWNSGNKTTKYKDSLYIHTIDKIITVTNCEEVYNDLKATEITLPQLRDIVVLKRNDVSDATHTYKCDKLRKYYIGHSVYRWHNSCWQEIPLNETYISGWLELIGDNHEMTWQDALRAVLDGKSVERFKDGEWQIINDAFKCSQYRLKPQTINIDGGDYTKEELLKIAGEMY